MSFARSKRSWPFRCTKRSPQSRDSSSRPLPEQAKLSRIWLQPHYPGSESQSPQGRRNLQEQLFFKDIPFLKDKVFPKLKTALLKGRGNFVCHERLRRFLRQPSLDGFFDPDALKEILAWYRKTRETGDGDRAELENLPDDDRIWPEICATSDTCLGKRCPDRDECFVLKMRSKAADVDIMVINHYLLASDLVVKESGYGEVVPRYDALIIDEAHGLEDALTQHFGFHVNQTRLTRLVRDCTFRTRSGIGKGSEVSSGSQRAGRSRSATLCEFPGRSSWGKALG